MKSARIVLLLVSIVLIGSNLKAFELKVHNQVYSRSKAKPDSFISQFPAVAGQATMSVNILGEGLSSAKVELNGSILLRPQDFNGKRREIVLPIAVSAENTLKIKIAGKPGASLRVNISQELESEGAAVIGLDGGIIEITDPSSPLLNTRVEIPSGAVEKEIVVQINAPRHNVPFSANNNGIGPGVEFLPHGVEFLKPVVLVLPYSDGEVKSEGIVDEEDLKLYHFNEEYQAWQQETTSNVDTLNNLVVSSVNHFSMFRLNGYRLVNLSEDLADNYTFDPRKKQVLLVHGVQTGLINSSGFGIEECFLRTRLMSSGFGDASQTFGDLAEILSLSQKQIQVWGLNYDSWADIDISASNLAKTLSKIQKNDGENTVPVFILAHSLGGLVTRSYVQGDNYAETHGLQGAMLLGTPNNGSYFAEAGHYILESISSLADSGACDTLGLFDKWLIAKFGLIDDENTIKSFSQMVPGSRYLDEINDFNANPIRAENLKLYNVFSSRLVSIDPLGYNGISGDGIVSVESARLQESQLKVKNYEVEGYLHSPMGKYLTINPSGFWDSLYWYDDLDDRHIFPGIAHFYWDDWAGEVISHDVWPIVEEFLSEEPEIVEDITFEDDFEAEVTGSIPSQWRNGPWSNRGTNYVTIDPVSTENKVLKATSYRSNQKGVYAPGSLNRNNHTLALDVFLPGGGRVNYYYGGFDYAGFVVFFKCVNGGEADVVLMTQGTGATVIGRITTQQWHSLKIDIDWLESSLDLSVDSNPFVNGYRFTKRDSGGWGSDLSVRGDNNLGPRTIYIDNVRIGTLGEMEEAQDGTPIYNPGNNHYYRYVADAVTWHEAKRIAEESVWNGLLGHLVTMTSAEENTFVRSIIEGTIHFGASDERVEGVWEWVSGPETGTQIGFYNSTLPGMYSNWMIGQPAPSWAGAEDYANMPVSYPDGKWADGRGSTLVGYVIEYE